MFIDEFSRISYDRLNPPVFWVLWQQIARSLECEERPTADASSPQRQGEAEASWSSLGRLEVGLKSLRTSWSPELVEWYLLGLNSTHQETLILVATHFAKYFKLTTT